MRLLELEIDRFGAYQQPTELDFRGVDVCAITGANGAGKSTLGDAVLWALYGSVPDRNAADLVSDTGGPTRVRVLAEFDGARHEFIRERSKREAAALWRAPCGTETIGARAVTDAAQRLLGADRETLIFTAWARQGDTGRFGAMDPSGRRAVLASALLGDMFDRAASTVDAAVRDAVENAAEARAKVAEVTDTAADLHDAETAETSASAEAAAAAQRLEALTAAAAAAADATARIEAIAAARARADAAAAAAETAETTADAAAESAARRRAASVDLAAAADASAAQLAGASAGYEAAARAEAAASALAEQSPQRLEALARSGAECDTCGAELTADGAAELVAREHSRLDAAADSATAAAAAADALRTARREHDTATAAVAEAEKAIAALDTEEATHRAAAAAARAAHAAAVAEIEPTDALEARAAGAPSETILAEARDGHDSAQQALGSARNRAAAARAAAGRLKTLTAAAANAADRSTGVELLRKALVPSGVPHLALETGLHTAAAATNDALLRLGQQEIRFRCEPAPGESRTPLTIEARDGAGSGLWRPYGTFSGGERMRMDIAQRIGWQTVLGVDCRTMLLDEGFGALDADATASVMRLLPEVVASGLIDMFLMISHVPAVADGCPWRIEVTRSASGSRAELVAN